MKRFMTMVMTFLVGVVFLAGCNGKPKNSAFVEAITKYDNNPIIKVNSVEVTEVEAMPNEKNIYRVAYTENVTFTESYTNLVQAYVNTQHDAGKKMLILMDFQKEFGDFKEGETRSVKREVLAEKNLESGVVQVARFDRLY